MPEVSANSSTPAKSWGKAGSKSTSSTPSLLSYSGGTGDSLWITNRQETQNSPSISKTEVAKTSLSASGGSDASWIKKRTSDDAVDRDSAKESKPAKSVSPPSQDLPENKPEPVSSGISGSSELSLDSSLSLATKLVEEAKERINQNPGAKEVDLRNPEVLTAYLRMRDDTDPLNWIILGYRGSNTALSVIGSGEGDFLYERVNCNFI